MRYYKVAGHVFGVTAKVDGRVAKPEDFANYEPFRCDAGQTAFVLSIDDGKAPDYTEELRQEEEGQVIVCGMTADGMPVFEFIWWQQSAGYLICSADYREGRLVTTGHHTKMATDNALMVLYALATAQKGTALFHAAVVSHEGKGYMFLGPSGTGKSTHAGLWLRHVEGAALVNDDNPVVRIGEDGCAMVYGSPWSGKTPCYRNVGYPLGGVVTLSQAPYNRIRRLSGIHAYAALVTGISGKRWDTRIADGLHWTENRLASDVPIWHLECLPDDAAARLCQMTIEHDDYR